MNDTTTTDEAAWLDRAREADPAEFLEMLSAVTAADEEAQEAARRARRQLNLMIKVGLERSDIVNRRMVETTGIKERDLYKRKDRV